MSAHLHVLHRVEAVGGLVEEEHVRRVHQRLRHPDPLAVTVAEDGDALVVQRGEPGALLGLGDPRLDAAGVHRAQSGDEGQVLADGHVLVERWRLGGNPMRALIWRGAVRRSWPSRRTVPDVGRSTQPRIRNVVVFPAPFRPRKPTTSPGSMRNERFRMAARAP
jgi:hypothetical protein